MKYDFYTYKNKDELLTYVGLIFYGVLLTYSIYQIIHSTIKIRRSNKQLRVLIQDLESKTEDN